MGPVPRQDGGEDASTREALSLAARVAPTGLTVLVLGETGTGKEVVAREVHRLSGRGGPFVAVNVAALPDTLAESELFGHARGAFTGADRERKGLVEASSGGTLFLDEVGELSPPVQAKLLRVLQEREVRRLGETRERTVDLRVVAATHRDLPSLVRAGRFREDLLWRFAGAEVRLAPLRERPRDVAALAQRFLAGRGALSPAARERLLRHEWPGNVRELFSALESALALAGEDGRISEEHLPAALRGAGPAAEDSPGAPVRAGPGAGRYAKALESARRAVIARALAESGGNRSRAAAWLGVSRQTLLYEMKKLGIG